MQRAGAVDLPQDVYRSIEREALELDGVSVRRGVVPCHGQVPPLFIGPMGWSHGAGAVTKQTFVWRGRAFCG